MLYWVKLDENINMYPFELVNIISVHSLSEFNFIKRWFIKFLIGKKEWEFIRKYGYSERMYTIKIDKRGRKCKYTYIVDFDVKEDLDVGWSNFKAFKLLLSDMVRDNKIYNILK